MADPFDFKDARPIAQGDTPGWTALDVGDGVLARWVPVEARLRVTNALDRRYQEVGLPGARAQDHGRPRVLAVTGAAEARGGANPMAGLNSPRGELSDLRSGASCAAYPRSRVIQAP